MGQYETFQDIMNARAAMSSDQSDASSSDSEQQLHEEDYQETPRFGFGLIADVQWADIDDGSNFAKTSIRHYRGAFAQLVKAVDWWSDINESCQTNSGDSSREEEDEKKEIEDLEGLTSFDALSPSSQRQSPPLSFVAQLGDLIDGINASLGTSKESLAKALDQLDRLDPTVCPSINLVGNHELYNFNRHQLQNEAHWLRHGNAEYYSFLAFRGFRVIVLDAYQLSLIGFGDDQKDDPRRLAAVKLLAKENPNISPDGAAGSNWFDGIPEGSYQRRFVPYNGGFGQEQLEWLNTELESAKSNEERVIVLSHVVMHPKACGGSWPSSFVWDYDKALEVVNSCKNEDGSSVVVAVLCGHDHGGGYYYDDDCEDDDWKDDNNSETETSTRSGIHHITVASPLNKGADGSAYGIVRVFDDKLQIVGPNLNDLLPPDRGGLGDIPRKPFVGDLGGGKDCDSPLESISFSF